MNDVSTQSMIIYLPASVSEPEFMGPALDAIYDGGFKIEAVIPDTDQAEDPNI